MTLVHRRCCRLAFHTPGPSRQRRAGSQWLPPLLSQPSIPSQLHSRSLVRLTRCWQLYPAHQLVVTSEQQPVSPRLPQWPFSHLRIIASRRRSLPLCSSMSSKSETSISSWIPKARHFDLALYSTLYTLLKSFPVSALEECKHTQCMNKS